MVAASFGLDILVELGALLVTRHVVGRVVHPRLAVQGQFVDEAASSHWRLLVRRRLLAHVGVCVLL